MVMRFLILAVAALLPATSAAKPPVPQPAMPRALNAFGPMRSDCKQTTSHYAWDRSQPQKPRKLTELPDANAYAAVYRRVNGCEEPLVVSYGVSGR
jgi:hypothetical protein